MKLLLPLTLALFLAACAVPITPEERADARQAQLEKEARENFYALKKQANPNYTPPSEATPKPAPGLFASAPRSARPNPTPVQRTQKVASRSMVVTGSDGTLYYWDAKSPPPAT